MSVGAVSLVGQGPSAAAEAGGASPQAEELWAITVDSEVGWYAIVSASCDIERDPAIEPAVVIAPIQLVNKERWTRLRSGSYSPREFPFPPEKLARELGRKSAELFPVVDVRYVTTLDKQALVRPEVHTLRPLTAPQAKRLGLWVGQRFARAAHPGEIEDNVLEPLGTIVKSLVKRFANPGGNQLDAVDKLIGAAEEWLLLPSDRVVDLTIIVSEASCRKAGLWNTKTNTLDETGIDAGATKLAGRLRAALPRGAGYVVRVTPNTLHGMSASDYVGREPWSWADAPDPLE